jgi:hypothetical protein
MSLSQTLATFPKMWSTPVKVSCSRNCGSATLVRKVFLVRISYCFRREAQREPRSVRWQPERSGSQTAGTANRQHQRSCPQGAAGINDGADFGGRLCEYTQRLAAIAATEKRSHSAQPEERRQSAVKIKPDVANAWLPQSSAAIAASPKRSLSAQPEERRQPAAENCEKSGLEFGAQLFGSLRNWYACQNGLQQLIDPCCVLCGPVTALHLSIQAFRTLNRLGNGC